MGPPNVLKSGEEGEGLASPPAPSGRTARLYRLANALHDLCETCIYIGCITHYEDDLEANVLVDLTSELNERTAEVVSATGESYPWHSDVDVVFEAVHAAAATALRCLRKEQRQEASNWSGSPSPDKARQTSSPRRCPPQSS